VGIVPSLRRHQPGRSRSRSCGAWPDQAPKACARRGGCGNSGVCDHINTMNPPAVVDPAEISIPAMVRFVARRSLDPATSGRACSGRRHTAQRLPARKLREPPISATIFQFVVPCGQVAEADVLSARGQHLGLKQKPQTTSVRLTDQEGNPTAHDRYERFLPPHHGQHCGGRGGVERTPMRSSNKKGLRCVTQPPPHRAGGSFWPGRRQRAGRRIQRVSAPPSSGASKGPTLPACSKGRHGSGGQSAKRGMEPRTTWTESDSRKPKPVRRAVGYV